MYMQSFNNAKFHQLQNLATNFFKRDSFHEKANSFITIALTWHRYSLVGIELLLKKLQRDLLPAFTKVSRKIYTSFKRLLTLPFTKPK